MYDPFASPPPQGAMTAAGIPQTPAVMPNPAPVSQNNALAALYNKHMRNLAGPNGQFPLNPGAQQNPDWHQQFQQARTDWRGDMPERPTFEGPQPDDWRSQMDAFKTTQRDWRQLKPRPGDYRHGLAAVSGPASGV